MSAALSARSLHLRLSIALGCVAVLVGLLGSLGTFLVVRSLATEFDSSLRDAAAHIRANAADPSAARGALPPQPEDLIVQIWAGGDGARPNRTSNPAVVLPRAEPGFSTIMSRGEQWDVFALEAGNDYIQLAELHRVRTGNAVRVASWGLLPILALLPVLALTIAVIVRVSLRPLDQLGRRVAKIDLNNLRPLDDAGAPEEMRPFLDSINLMMQRLSVRVDAERKFIADAAHELRSPISAMQLHVDNLRNATPQEQDERLDALQRGINRTSSLVSQLLGLARADAGPAGKALADLSLPRMVADVVADLLPLAIERGVDLGAGELADLTIRAVEADLRVLIKNLVDNAIRYSGADSHVDVSVFRTDDEAVVQVVDSGPGIAEADLHRVFDRFYRSGESEEEGSGLGLSIAEALAGHYGGRVTIANRTDGTSGVVARIELPLP
ncbi:MAG TPA: ATP-binding protein [Paraburkholderia sp.]|jgi:two-component system OmpR family sensor kinase